MFQVNNLWMHFDAILHQCKAPQICMFGFLLLVITTWMCELAVIVVSLRNVVTVIRVVSSSDHCNCSKF